MIIMMPQEYGIHQRRINQRNATASGNKLNNDFSSDFHCVCLAAKVAFIRMRSPCDITKNIQYSNWIFSRFRIAYDSCLWIAGQRTGHVWRWSEFLWAYHRGGTTEFRPFMAWIRDFGYLIYHSIPAFWWKDHWLAAGVTAAALDVGTAVFHTLPLRPKPIIWWAALLFLFYPGFLQQAIRLNLSFISSRWTSFWHPSCWCSWRFPTLAENGFLLIGSFGFEVIGLFLCEYFISLELVRPFLVSHTMTTDTQNSSEACIPLKKKGTHRNVLPLLISFIIYLG